MIVIRSDDEIKAIRSAGAIVARTLDELRRMVRPGIRTDELDAIGQKTITSAGGIPAFKGYKGYPASVCTSLNEVVVHGIPSKRRLVEGDIISLDVGVAYDGYFADAAITCAVGTISAEAQKLITVTEESLVRGIAAARPGNRLSDISWSVQRHAEENGFSVVRSFVGHGIGTHLHEEPEIPNFGLPHHGVRLEAGMVLAIEPMVNAGTYHVEILDDGWTAVTKDGKLSAHSEHTIVITRDEPQILTRA